MRRDEALNILKVSMPDLKTRFGVTALHLFGSTARDEATGSSDVDVLVEFSVDSNAGLFALSRVKSYLMEACGCNVHLLTPGAVHPRIRENVERDAVRAGKLPDTYRP